MNRKIRQDDLVMDTSGTSSRVALRVMYLSGQMAACQPEEGLEKKITMIPVDLLEQHVPPKKKGGGW